MTVENDPTPIAFLPYGLPPNLAAAFDREMARYNAAIEPEPEPESNIVYGVDFVNKRRA